MDLDLATVAMRFTMPNLSSMSMHELSSGESWCENQV